MRGLILLLVTVSALIFRPSSASAADPVQVTVTKQEVGGVTTYNYTVRNNSTQPIVSVRIGLDYLHGVAELRTPPVGWKLSSGLAPESTAAPRGWMAALVTEEESPFFNLEWNSSDDSTVDINPTATLGGFSVRVPSSADEYRLPQFDILFGDATHAYGRVQIAVGKQRVARH